MTEWDIGDVVMVIRGTYAHRVGNVSAVHKGDRLPTAYDVQLHRVVMANEHGRWETVQEALTLLVSGANLKMDPTQWGFQYGPVEVIRVAAMPNKGKGMTHVLSVKTDHGHELQISVSATGRSLRVYRRLRDEREFSEMAT